VRTRDLLPMALPDLTLTRAWVASQDGPRRKRQRFRMEGRLVAREFWSYIVVLSLNFEYVGRGDPRLWRHSPVLYPAQRSAYKTIISHVDGFLDDPLTRRPDIDWSQKISKLRVDYTGEEQGEALPIKLAELIPGLPDKQHAAQLQMEEFVDEHILEWLMDPEVATLPAAEWPLDPPRARVNCERLEDWCEVAEHLIGLGILGVVDEADIFAPPGQKVFNGLFAREKMGKPLEGQSRCTRLIFNMIPSNAYLRNIVEDTSTLAASASWTSLHLPAGCVMVWSSDDQKGAFYVWKLPPVWYGRMAVSVPVPASSAGLPGDHLVYVAFRVIPMGWVLAVTLFQHLHRRLALRAPRLGAGLPAEAEWRRDQPWPLARQHPHAWWQVYSDDFDAPEVLEAAEAYRVVGTPGEMQLAMRRAYTQAEVAYAEEKSHARQLQLERMGASIDGCAGTIRAPADKVIELVRYILYALGRDCCPWLLMLTLLGRAVRALEFRRPLLSCLNSVWEFSTRTRGGRINMGMSQELLACIGYLPIACTDLRAALSPVATVSDASEAGGGVCASTGLTPLAVQQLRAARQGARPVLGPGRGDLQPARSSPSLPGGRPRPRVLIVSLFDGVAALAVAMSRLPVDIVGMVCSEVDKPARRVVRLRWPGTADWGDIRSISEKDVAKLADTYYSLCDVCVRGAGSPCQDLSAVNLSRAGLAGPSSKLFYEIPRVHGLLRKHFKEKLATFVENVASMSPQVRDAITKELGLLARGLPAEALFARGSCPLVWGEIGTYTKGTAEYDKKLASEFTGEFLALSDRSGSDIRLAVGLLHRPKAGPRASISPFNWNWRVVVSLRWQGSIDIHVHARELQGIAEYMEMLWSEGQPVSFANYAVAAMGFFFPSVKQSWELSWSLLKAWRHANRLFAPWFRMEGRLVAREFWSYIVVLSLNFEYVGRGDPRLWRHSPVLHPAQRSAYKTIISHVDGFLDDPLTRRPDIDWSQKISKLRVDYTGEEQGEALPIKLAEPIPGLPDKQHAAQLQTEGFVDGHILEWLMDHEVAALPDADWPLHPPRARVSCARLEDWYEVAEHLIGLGILGVVDEADIFAQRGQKVFNGLFARESLHLPEGCVMVWSSDDQKGAFYVWKLPPIWYGRMAVSVPVPASSAGLPGDHLVYVAFRVIPMGWVSAVTLFQHLHCRLALRAPRLGAGLPAEAEWTRNQPWPLARQHPHAWWQVYIDDFDAPEVLEAAEAYQVVGAPGEMQLAMRRAYTQAEVAYAEEKSHARQLRLERMGVSIDGCAGTIRAPANKVIELVRYILYALGRDYCPWLLMLTLLGRAVLALEFRRPLLSCLNLVWEFPTRTRGRRINMGMSQELLVCIGYLPIACTDLRAALSPVATVSDASEAGGGVCASTGLTPLAVQQLRAARQGARPVLGPGRGDLVPARSSPLLPGGRPRPRVLIVSRFDGIAALAVAMSRLPVDIIGMVCSEVDKPARRVVRLRWPGTADWGDIRSISEKDVAKLADTYYSLCDVCVCGAGSPCQDLSAVSLSRAGLASPSSKLFYEIPRVHGLLRKHFKEKLATFVENVASMSPQVRDAITKEREALLGFDKNYTRVAHKDPEAQGLLARGLPAEALFARGSCPLVWGGIGTYTKGTAEYDKKLASEFTGEFLALSDRSGSDIRLAVGLLHRPKAGPRASISPFNWNWRVVVSLRWQGSIDIHVHARELQAGVAALLWRTRSTEHLSARFVHLFDPQVGSDHYEGAVVQYQGIAEYMEMLWSEGQPVSFANYAVAAMGFFFPSVKQSWELSWSLLKLILGIAALPIECDAVDISTLLALGFAGLFRTTEVFTLSKQQVAIINDGVSVRLPETKTGHRKATTEMVVVGCPIAVDLVKRWYVHAAPPDTTSTR
ncbi:unnamed protein product, partial [Prorocentrum cordatum]